jgi:hypothetical protein
MKYFLLSCLLMLSVNAVAGSASVHWLGIEDYTDLKGGDGVKEDQYANEFFTLIEKEIRNISTSVLPSDYTMCSSQFEMSI